MSWCKPPPRVSKLNIDGAIFPNQHKARVGISLRDDTDTIPLATSMKESEVNDPIEIELVAMLRGLQLCLSMGIEDLMLESDFLFYGKPAEQDTDSWPLLGSII